MTFETERVILRPWTEDDAKSLYEYAKDPRIGPAAGWPPHTSPENSREIIRTVLSKPETYAVVPKSVGIPVGSAGIMTYGSSNVPLGKTEGEIGYWIGVPFWGMGLIPEAVDFLLLRCFGELNLSAVWCAYYDGNEKSRRVQEKCGFIYHHTTQDVSNPALGNTCTEHYTLLTKERWLKIRPIDFKAEK